MRSVIDSVEVEPHGDRWQVFTVTMGCRFPANIPIGKKFHGEQLLGFTTKEAAELQAEQIRQVSGLSFDEKRQRGVKAKEMAALQQKMAQAMADG